MKNWRIAGINFDHLHMGDLLREVYNHKYAEIVGICDQDINKMQSAQKNFNISKDEIEIAKRELNKNDKFEVEHIVNAKDNNGVICASATINIYLRKK